MRKTVKEVVQAVLKRNSKALTPAQIATKGKLNYNTVRRVVRELLSKYEVNSVDGKYWIGLRRPLNTI